MGAVYFIPLIVCLLIGLKILAIMVERSPDSYYTWTQVSDYRVRLVDIFQSIFLAVLPIGNIIFLPIIVTVGIITLLSYLYNNWFSHINVNRVFFSKEPWLK
jgi:hypothetical protein